MKRIAIVTLLTFLITHHSPITAHPAVLLAGQDQKPEAKSRSGPRVYKGRVIAPVMTAAGGGADWLERPDRDETEQPDKVIEALKIPPGSVVADVGAGTGYFSIRVAKKIAPEGKVLATDVQPEMLRQLTENMKKAGVKNIDRILATANDSKLPAGKVDLVLMVDVYHELQDPERTMAQIRKSLKSDGRLVLVEYRGEDPDVPIKPEHKTTLRQIRYEIEPMGFRLKDVFEFLPHQHIEVFVKDEVKGEDEIINPNDFPTVRKPGWAGAASAEPYEKAGFKRLFNGKNLDGWRRGVTYPVEDGAIVVEIKGSFIGQAEILTDDKFDDFELDFQWRLKAPEGKVGLVIRNNPMLLVQLEAGVPHSAGYPRLLSTRRTGEVYAPETIQRTNDTANALLFPGEWNRTTVRCVGRHVRIAINGIETANFEAGDGESTAPVGFQPVRGRAEFREIWIRRLDR